MKESEESIRFLWHDNVQILHFFKMTKKVRTSQNDERKKLRHLLET